MLPKRLEFVFATVAYPLLRPARCILDGDCGHAQKAEDPLLGIVDSIRMRKTFGNFELQSPTTGVFCVEIFDRMDLSILRWAFTSSHGVNANH